MGNPRVIAATEAQVAAGIDSQQPRDEARRIPAQLREAEVLERTLLTVQEVAFLLRIGVRSVWRMVADPRSGLPKPRRLRGRTLFARDEVLAFVAEEAAR